MEGTLPWIYLTFAGLMEIGRPVGLKMAQAEGQRVICVTVALAFMLTSGFLLWLAQKDIPIGTSYAVWTGIGAAGTFIYGILFYGDAAGVARSIGVGRFSSASSPSSYRMSRAQPSCASDVTGRTIGNFRKFFGA